MNELTAVLKKAGELMLRFEHPQVFAKGGHADFVTEADVAVQEYLMEQLARLYPTAKFFAEEKKDNVLTDDFTFIIDPIDGTTNLMYGMNMSVISCGYCEDGEPKLAVVYQPFTNELYTAEKGKGAFLNGQPNQVANSLDFALSKIAFVRDFQRVA